MVLALAPGSAVARNLPAGLEPEPRAERQVPANMSFAAAAGLYRRGELTEARRMLLAIAPADNPRAHDLLGHMLARGEGGPADPAAAARSFRAGAAHGDAGCQFGLASLYARGIGVPRDDGRAAHWARLAAEQGHPQAMSNLGILLATGRGVPMDKVAAMSWLIAALARGHEPAREHRRVLAGELSPGQMAEADRRASAWLASHPAGHLSAQSGNP